MLLNKLEPFFIKVGNAEAPQQTIDTTTFWENTVAEAQSTFSKEEFEIFKSLINEFKTYESKVVDSDDASVHNDHLSAQDKQDLEQLNERLKPYFDKLGMMVKSTP